jgi:hypothetical protein
MELILVSGPWSSGTTAISGMLLALGLDGFGPYYKTVDPRTPNSFESEAFRRAVKSFASERPLARTKEPMEILERLRVFKGELEAHRAENAIPVDMPMFLKYPLSALVLPEMAKVFDTRLIYVMRPVRDIEATRARRRWHENLGAKGASVIYGSMFNHLVNHSTPTMVVRYPEVLQDPHEHARRFAEFAGLKDVSKTQIDTSAAAIRQLGPASR